MNPNSAFGKENQTRLSSPELLFNPSTCSYELNGIPLPFASDKVFDALFPVSPEPLLSVARQGIKVVPTPKRIYDASSIPICPVCGSKRVFEVQLMPNLINILTKHGDKKTLTEDERKKAIERALIGGDGMGMEWGTCIVFSCEKDCCLDDDGKSEVQDCWREEVVLVQWDV
jgi:pre-rRNA-processing protein TSR4